MDVKQNILLFKWYLNPSYRHTSGIECIKEILLLREETESWLCLQLGWLTLLFEQSVNMADVNGQTPLMLSAHKVLG